MKTIMPLFLGVLCFGLSNRAHAQSRNFDNVEIKTHPVSGNIHMLEGQGGNIGVSAGPDGVLIIDSQFAPLSPKIEAAIEKLGKGKPKFLLNTHWHGDHTGGNANFGRYADIIAHAKVRQRLAGGDRPTSKPGLPVITFDDRLSVHFNGEEIRMVHVPPGHTDGDSIIFFTGSKVVHMGDQFFNGRFPYIDLGSGGDVEGYVKNVGNMISQIPADAKIIPGHGPLATLADLKTFHAALEETVGLVRSGIAAGKTLEQIKAGGVPAKYKEWGSGFMSTSRYLEIVYNSLTKK